MGWEAVNEIDDDVVRDANGNGNAVCWRDDPDDPRQVIAAVAGRNVNGVPIGSMTRLVMKKPQQADG